MSCASNNKSPNQSSNQMTTAGVQQTLVQGKTTKAEVIKLYGAPELVNATSNGKEQWVYSKTKSEWNGNSSGIGTAGLAFLSDYALGVSADFGSSKETHSNQTQTLSINFNKRGVIDYYEFTNSKI